jgi:hypothetical protein
MAAGIVYLVHFPDHTKAVHNIMIGRVAEQGTEILDGWIVDKIEEKVQIVGEQAVRFEVWVRPRLTH